MTFETAEKFRPNADMQETDALIYLLRSHIISASPVTGKNYCWSNSEV